MTHRHKDAPLADLLMLPLAALLRLEEQRIVFAARALRLEAQARTLEVERDHWRAEVERLRGVLAWKRKSRRNLS